MNARRFFRLICFSLLFVSPASGYCQSPVAQPNLGIKKLAFEVPTNMITTSYLSGTMKVAASDIYVVNFPDLKPKKLAAGSNPAWSPDGEQIAFCVRKGTGFGQLQVANADGSRQRAISQIQKGACDPDWSPDGLKIAFTLYGGKAPGIYVVGSSGGDAIQIAEGFAAHWSPDGTKLIFMGPGQKDSSQHTIWIANADGSGARVLLPVDGSTEGVRWLPNGKGIVFSSLHDSRQVAFWMNLDGSNFKEIGASNCATSFDPIHGSWQCGVYSPIVSPDGKKLVLIGSANEISEKTLISVPGGNAKFSPPAQPQRQTLMSSGSYYVPYVAIIDSETGNLTRIVRGSAQSIVWASQ